MTHQDQISSPDDPREPVPNWVPPTSCRVQSLKGRTVRIEPLDEALHSEGLWNAFGGEAINERIYWFGWPKLSSPDNLMQRLRTHAQSDGWSTAVMLIGDKPAGMASYMREDAPNGVVEIGAVAHAEALSRSVAATEAHYLLMAHAFSLGYRRYEWKSDNANEPSKRAALRLGFTFEGVFRQHAVKHGRSRDTAWFSMLDKEWPQREACFKRWLDPENFDETGKQIERLNMSV